MIEQTKFVYSPFRKAFERQTKTIKGQPENQVKIIEEHGKLLTEINKLDKKT